MSMQLFPPSTLGGAVRATLLLTLAAAAVPVETQAAAINGCVIGPALLCIERDLRGAALRGSDLSRADLRKSNLSGADLSQANLLSANLELAKFNRANLSGANLKRADLKRAELLGANLRNADMTDANLHSADLNGAVLDGARLDGANLSGVDLPGASLRAASLERSDVRGAVLSNADLRGANLVGANFSNASLVGADLTGARTAGAVFEGANLSGCAGCPSRVAQIGSVPDVNPPLPPLAPGSSLFASSAFAMDDGLAKGCWARLYREERFAGTPLTLVGPVEVENLGLHDGFPWDPQYESVQVGPAATLTVYDNTRFRNRTAVFKAGRRIPDLDDEMGVFRTLRSARVQCRP